MNKSLSEYQKELIALFRESVVTQAILTLMSGGTIFYLIIVGREVPEMLLNMFWSLAGVWIGGKIALAPTLKRKRSK